MSKTFAEYRSSKLPTYRGLGGDRSRRTIILNQLNMIPADRYMHLDWRSGRYRVGCHQHIIYDSWHSGARSVSQSKIRMLWRTGWVYKHRALRHAKKYPSDGRWAPFDTHVECSLRYVWVHPLECNSLNTEIVLKSGEQLEMTDDVEGGRNIQTDQCDQSTMDKMSSTIFTNTVSVDLTICFKICNGYVALSKYDFF